MGIERFIAGVVARRWPILAAAAVLTVLSVWASAEVSILTSRKALLPAQADVSKRLDRFLDKFGSASDLIAVIEGAPRPELEEFASQFARWLEHSPRIRAANERVDLLFFLEHAYLMVPPPILAQFASVVDRLVGVDPPEQLTGWKDAWARTEAWLDEPPDLGEMDIDLKTAEESLHLVVFFLEQWLRWLDDPAPPLSIAWNTMLARHGAESLASGYYASRDGKMLFVFVRAVETSEEYGKLKPFIEQVRHTADELSARWREQGRTPPKVGLTGLPAATFEEFEAVKHDILLTVGTAAFLIILLILVWLRSLRWALVVFVPMALGVVWNIGFAYLLLGHLTIITSGFTAILFGLGVDYGIFMSTRIIEERGRHPDLLRAITRGSAASARALLVAGGATILIFASLAFVEFDGFAELGMVAASGVGLVLLSTFLIQPILFLWLPPKVGPAAREDEDRPVPAPARRMKISGPIPVLLVLAAVAGAVAGGAAAFGIPFDYDVMSLLPRDSETAHYQRRMLEESDYQGEVLIFTAPTIDQAQAMATQVAALPSIARVQSITDLFPADAALRAQRAREIGRKIDESEYARRIRKLGWIELTAEDDERIDRTLVRMQALIEDGQEQAFSAGHGHLVEVMERILADLTAIQKKRAADPQQSNARTRLFVQTMIEAGKGALDVLKAWSGADVLTPNELPLSLKDRFFADDGTVAFYAFAAGNIYDIKTLDALMEQVYAISPEATGFPTTHHVFSRMVVDSFRQGALAAILVAILWIGLVLRRLRGLIIASLPLLVGGGWMMGVMALLEMKFNFANIIGLPLVMGLAVDYGVWFAHRQHELSGHGGWLVARRAGKAILLAAGTTLAGLGAITLASYRGISSMGVAITIGLVCCVTTAMLISPAITELMFRRKP